MGRIPELESGFFKRDGIGLLHIQGIGWGNVHVQRSEHVTDRCISLPSCFLVVYWSWNRWFVGLFFYSRFCLAAVTARQIHTASLPHICTSIGVGRGLYSSYVVFSVRNHYRATVYTHNRYRTSYASEEFPNRENSEIAMFCTMVKKTMPMRITHFYYTSTLQAVRRF